MIRKRFLTASSPNALQNYRVVRIFSTLHTWCSSLWELPGKENSFLSSQNQRWTASLAQAFYLQYFLGISVGLQALLLMGLCRTTAGFSHLKGQVLKIIRGQCVVRRQQQVSVFWDTWTATAKRFYLMTWLVSCAPRAVLGVDFNGLMTEVCITETCVSQHWGCLLIAGSGREKCVKSLGFTSLNKNIWSYIHKTKQWRLSRNKFRYAFSCANLPCT